jgi:hypothetical protein
MVERRALVQNAAWVRDYGAEPQLASWREDGIPSARHGFVIDAKHAEVELALSEQRQVVAFDIACPDPSGYQAVSARHSPSAAERLCL